MPSYYINAIGNVGGPKIFGKKLSEQFNLNGWHFDSVNQEYNTCFVSGDYKPNSCNILRLDGILYDIKNTLGNTDELNAPIKKTYDKFDKIIFQSEWGKKLVFKHFGETNKPHKVIYNGTTDSSNSDTYSYPFKKTLICASRWRTHKRLRDIIEAFRLIEDKGVGLVVLGTPDIENIYYYPDRVLFVGEVNNKEIPCFLNGADAFVHLAWLDCCPNAVVEALSCGLPVLCGHNGGTKELVKDNGVILKLENDFNFERIDLYNPPISDPEIVAQGMINVLKKEKKFYRHDLDIKNIAKQYMDFIVK